MILETMFTALALGCVALILLGLSTRLQQSTTFGLVTAAVFNVTGVVGALAYGLASPMALLAAIFFFSSFAVFGVVFMNVQERAAAVDPKKAERKN